MYTVSHAASSAVATRSTDQPMNELSAAARTRDTDDGRSIASNNARHSLATGVPKTLPAPAITAGTPDGLEYVAYERPLTMSSHQHRDVAGPEGRRARGLAVITTDDQFGARGEERHDVGGQVVGHLLPG